MISIVTVNFNSYDFLWLMIESLERYSSVIYKVIVIDNSDADKRLKVAHPHVHQFAMPSNVGHGQGLNMGITRCLDLYPRHKYVMFLDVDCHIVAHNWDQYFIESMKKYDIIGAKGVASKPIRPACLFMKRNLANYDWSPSEGFAGNRLTPGGYDVAIRAYYKIMADGFNVGFTDSTKNRYETTNGEEYVINDVPLIYHHWSGTWLKTRQQDFPDVDLIEDKQKLFNKIPWRIP